jgi:hypothetical protein
MDALCHKLERCGLTTTRELHLASLHQPPRDAAWPSRVPTAGEFSHTHRAARSTCPLGARGNILCVVDISMCVLAVSVVHAPAASYQAAAAAHQTGRPYTSW